MEIEMPGENYDIVVIGGGMVGASFALALSQRVAKEDLSLLVVEATAPSADISTQTSFDARSTALSFGSRQIFQKMGVWGALEKSVAVISEIQVSDKGRLGSTQLSHDEQGVEALGYVVENAKLGSILNTELSESESLAFVAPAKIEKITPRQAGMELVLQTNENSHKVNAKLVVLADGGRSPICSQLGIEQLKESYKQFGIITNVAFEKPHQNIAYERFTDSGPLALLPLQKFEGTNRCSLVWTVSESEREELMQAQEKGFIASLQTSVGNRLGQITHVGEKFCYPLSLSVAKEQIRPGLVLLGNVAHTLHPVAGQGLNLALRDIDVLVETIAAALDEGHSPGAMQTLQSYIDKQDFDQQKAISFTDSLIKLFSSNNSGKVAARKIGLLSLELVPTVRKRFAEQAMGLS